MSDVDAFDVTATCSAGVSDVDSIDVITTYTVCYYAFLVAVGDADAVIRW